MQLTKKALAIIASVDGRFVIAAKHTIVAIYGKLRGGAEKFQFNDTGEFCDPNHRQVVAIYPDGSLQLVTHGENLCQGENILYAGFGCLYDEETVADFLQKHILAYPSAEVITAARRSIASVNADSEPQNCGIQGFCIKDGEKVAIYKGRVGDKDVLLRHEFGPDGKPINLRIVENFNGLHWENNNSEIDSTKLEYIHPDIFALLVTTD